jgi:hypothetical protein
MAEIDESAGGIQSFKLRIYQQEMLEKSLDRNVILAMPTGSEYSDSGERTGPYPLTNST